MDEVRTSAVAAEKSKRATRGIVVVAIVALVAYAVLALATDARDVGKSLERFPIWILFAAMGLSFLNYCVRYVRWRIYCKHLDIVLAPGTSFLIHLSGLALTVSPGKMGEAFKSLLVRRVTGTPVAVSAPIVLAERFTDLLAFLVLIGIGTNAEANDHAWLGWVTLGLCAALFTVVSVRSIQRVLLAQLARFEWCARFVPKIEEGLASSRTLLQPRAIVIPTLIATAGWSLECFAFKLVAGAFVDGGVPFLFAASTFALAAVAGAVAFVFPGGLGITEASMGALLRARYAALGLGANIAAASAVSATILIRLATLWFAVLVGVLATLAFKRRHGGIG